MRCLVLAGSTTGKASSNPNVYVETPIATLRSLYRLLFEFRGDSELTLIDCSFNILGSDIQGWYVPRKKADKEAIDACLLVLQAVRSRAIAVECACSFQTIQIAIPPLDRILHGIVSGGNRRFAEIIAENHMESLARAYTANRISPDLDEHAGVALHLRDYLSPPALNNLGYYYFAKGQVENSKSLLEQSIALAKKNQIPFALASFNLAMIYFVIGDRVKAIDILRETTVGLEDEKPDCLFVPKVSSKGVDLIEVRKGLDLELERQSALNLLRDSDPTPQVN